MLFSHHHHHHDRHHHHHHHARNHNNWEVSGDSFPQGSSTNSGYKYFLDPPNSVRKNNEKATVCVKLGDKEICSESVDAVTEEFIKLEHKKFG
uniref:Uncharacterized protein n=1 Tax=Manihot esculenta TaxID=3983 RepID=A0A2C9UQ55_MANES